MRAHSDGEGSVDAAEEASHDQELAEVDVHGQLREVPTERRDLLRRSKSLGLERRQ